MTNLEEKAMLQSQMIEHALQHEELQDDPKALAAWAMQDLGVVEPYLASTCAMRALLTVQEYQQRREQLQAARTPQRRTPSKAEILIIPAKSAEHFLHDSEETHRCLHQKALVGAAAGYMGRSVMVHDDSTCIKMIGALQAAPVPVRLIGNEGYAPCSGCALPLAGPSLVESLAHTPLPVPADLADLLYGGPTMRFQEQPRRTRRKPHLEQRSLFDRDLPQ